MSKPLHWEFTKIVATIGPASDTVEQLSELMNVGMNVARLNTKHGTTEWHAERIRRIREAAKNVGKPVGILLDLQGPEIRVNLLHKESFDVEKGEQVFFVAELEVEKKKQIQIPPNVIESLSVGNTISLDDGTCEFEIVEKQTNQLVGKAKHACTCKDRKTMNTPGIVIDMPSLTKDDLEKLDTAKDEPVDFVALSFVRNKTDLNILKTEMNKRKIQASIVAKIENQAALDHLDEIIAESDAIMVARGDLAVEVPMEELTRWQKEIIKRSRIIGKPVITATQMLKSMVENSRPTRAEVSDVANAVFDGTDAVMLSEETTIGKYPKETVETMRKIVSYNEQYAQIPEYNDVVKNRTVAVTHMAMTYIQDQIEPIDTIVVFTETGFTAQQLIRHRPHTPVLVVTDREETQKRSTLLYAVYPALYHFPEGKVEKIPHLLEQLKKDNHIHQGQKILLIHGTDYKKPGSTNTVSIIEIE